MPRRSVDAYPGRHMPRTGPEHSLEITLLALVLAAASCGKPDAPQTLPKRQAQSIRDAADNTPAQNKALARAMIAEDYPEWNRRPQLECLDQLWHRESRWNHRAVNKRTGACGIPQSYPCKKMKAMGDQYGVNYRKNPWPQIAWGLAYIRNRYGSPCGAWKRFQRGGGY
ncbi:MAG: transglycosylase SLT domain-containing protein [Myxococcota bacterium]